MYTQIFITSWRLCVERQEIFNPTMLIALLSSKHPKQIEHRMTSCFLDNSFPENNRCREQLCFCPTTWMGWNTFIQSFHYLLRPVSPITAPISLTTAHMFSHRVLSSSTESKLYRQEDHPCTALFLCLVRPSFLLVANTSSHCDCITLRQHSRPTPPLIKNLPCSNHQ